MNHFKEGCKLSFYLFNFQLYLSWTLSVWLLAPLYKNHLKNIFSSIILLLTTAQARMKNKKTIFYTKYFRTRDKLERPCHAFICSTFNNLSLIPDLSSISHVIFLAIFFVISLHCQSRKPTLHFNTFYLVLIILRTQLIANWKRMFKRFSPF